MLSFRWHWHLSNEWRKRVNKLSLNQRFSLSKFIELSSIVTAVNARTLPKEIRQFYPFSIVCAPALIPHLWPANISSFPLATSSRAQSLSSRQYFFREREDDEPVFRILVYPFYGYSKGHAIIIVILSTASENPSSSIDSLALFLPLAGSTLQCTKDDVDCIPVRWTDVKPKGITPENGKQFIDANGIAIEELKNGFPSCHKV